MAIIPWCNLIQQFELPISISMFKSMVQSRTLLECHTSPVLPIQSLVSWWIIPYNAAVGMVSMIQIMTKVRRDRGLVGFSDHVESKDNPFNRLSRIQHG